VAVSTEEYTPGRPIEVVRPVGSRGTPVILLWHGSGPDERDALVPLATAIADRGPVVLVPDWRSDDPEAGPSELLASIEFVRTTARGLGGDPGRVVLAGWSLGAGAAADVALHPELAGGWHPSAVVGLAGGYDTSPFGGDPLARAPVGGAGRPGLVVHGTADTEVPPERSVEAAGTFAGAGWRVVLRQVDADHAGVIGTEYDRVRRRCVPTVDPVRLGVLHALAAEMADVALGPG